MAGNSILLLFVLKMDLGCFFLLGIMAAYYFERRIEKLGIDLRKSVLKSTNRVCVNTK